MSVKRHTSKVPGCGCEVCSPDLEPGSKPVTLEPGCNLCGTTEGGLMPIEAGNIEIRMPYFTLRSGAFTICTACGEELQDELRGWMKGLPAQLFRVAVSLAPSVERKPQAETVDLTASVNDVISAVSKALQGGKG